MSTSTRSSPADDLTNPPEGPDNQSAPSGTLARAVNEANLVEWARNRQQDGRTLADRVSAAVLGGSFLAASIGWVAVDRPDTPYVAVALLAVLHALASSIEFEVGPGSAVPTTPVLVAGLFLVPPSLLPPAVLVGLVLSSALTRGVRRGQREPALVLAVSAWHAFGPAVAATYIDPGDSRLHVAAVVGLGFAGQLVIDLVATAIRNCLGLGVAAGNLLPSFLFTACIDLLLAPLGLAAAWSVPKSVASLAFVVPLVGLLALIQRDRRQFVDHAVVLNDAYSSTSRQARVDSLTGLANRLAWDEAIESLSGKRCPIGVVALDVDGLKVANDRFGHDVGDRLIVAVAGIAANASSCIPGAVVARLGGDEFGVLLPGVDATELERLGDTLRQRLRQAPALEGAVPVSASVGYALSGDGAALSDALEAADQAAIADKLTRGVHRR